MSRIGRVLIIGGGIGGLTAAIALHRKGISAEVIEQKLYLVNVRRRDHPAVEHAARWHGTPPSWSVPAPPPSVFGCSR